MDGSVVNVGLLEGEKEGVCVGWRLVVGVSERLGAAVGMAELLGSAELVESSSHLLPSTVEVPPSSSSVGVRITKSPLI